MLLAVLQSRALVVLEQTVLATVVSLAEAAVTDDALCWFLAFLECAAELLGRHCEEFPLLCGGGFFVVWWMRRATAK